MTMQLVPRSTHHLPAVLPRKKPATILNRVVEAGRNMSVRRLDVQEAQRLATIAAIVPCYNEADSIAAVITGLLAQTRLPDVIHIVVNNSDDDTVEIAAQFAGYHERYVKGVRFTTDVHIHDMGANADKKVGALNYGYNLASGYDFILGVDGDTVLDKHCVEWLELEMADDTRIGGISAIYTVSYDGVKGLLAKFLTAGQRAQFAGFNMDNLQRGRNMAVLGGQCSLFRVSALERVKDTTHQHNPWVRDSEVEDSLLSLQIADAGFSTKISARARAAVGGMGTLRALFGQQVKWNFGAIELMWPGQRGNTKGKPFHPNLRLRWFENVSMLFNIGTRLGFALLLAASISIDAFVFKPVWLIPPAVAVLLNMRTALSMHDKKPTDVAFAVIGAEFYMWVRMTHFLAAWWQFLWKIEKDRWAAQADAESGKGSSGHLWPPLVIVVVFAATLYGWTLQDYSVQASILSVGWWGLLVITVMQTMFMCKKALRRTRGFKV